MQALDLPSEKEEIRLILDSLREPALLDHILDLLHGRVLVVAGKVIEDAERGDLTALARLELCEAVYKQHYVRMPSCE